VNGIALGAPTGEGGGSIVIRQTIELEVGLPCGF
jgi:hypothetical protein